MTSGGESAGGAVVAFAGEQMLAIRDGGLFWPAARALIVADLHLEKGSSFARRGRLLPPYDSRATLDRLARCIAASRPRRILCLGDSFHDGEASARLPPEERSTLFALARGREWIWIRGNHDPVAGERLPGDSAQEVALGCVTFRHRAAEAVEAGAEISGHWHPKAFVRVAGRRVGGRCFVAGTRRLILPAFGAFTGGLNVQDAAIAGLFPDGFAVYILGFRRVHRVPLDQLAVH